MVPHTATISKSPDPATAAQPRLARARLRLGERTSLSGLTLRDRCLYCNRSAQKTVETRTVEMTGYSPWRCHSDRVGENERQPSRRVLAAFGLDGIDMHDLPSGEEVSVLGRGVVLKRVQGPEVSAWSQALLADAQPCDDFRLPSPIRSDDGRWEVDGWIATEFIDELKSLQHDPARIIRVGEALSDILNDAKRDDSLPVKQRRDRWARADRFVWNEETVGLTAEAADLAARLRTRMSDDRSTPAVVHGDLSGNVFLDPLGVPVVLDFTPYIRPKRYGSAIVIADNLLWYDGAPTLARLIDNDEDGLARALLFRLVSEQLGSSPRHGANLADYRRTLASLGWA